MGDKWTTSGGWRLKSKQSRTFAARPSQKNPGPTGSAMMTTLPVTSNTKGNNPSIHPMLRKRNGGVQGGYSAYADPIARRAIVVSTDQQYDNANTTNHPIHPSRLQTNIRRRIRDPSQRSEIIAHYNPDVRDSVMQKREWEYANRNAQRIAPPMFAARQPSRSQGHSPPFVGTVSMPSHSTQPYGDLFLQQQEQNMHCDGSYEIHFSDTMCNSSTAQANNYSGQSNNWNETSTDGIARFQHNRNVTPSLTSSTNAFYAPSGFQHNLPSVHYHSPAPSQILPFDNFICPSEQQNSDARFASTHDDMYNDVDFSRKESIPWKKSHPLTYEGFSKNRPHSNGNFFHQFGRYSNVAAHNIDPSCYHASTHPLTYPGMQESDLPAEVFNQLPTLHSQPIGEDHSDLPAFRYSEPTTDTDLNRKTVPPFSDQQTLHRTDLEVTKSSDDFRNPPENLMVMSKISWDCNINKDINLTATANPSTAKGKSLDSFGLRRESRSETSSKPDHLEYPIVRHPKPFTVPTQIRFFNEGVEVDINNRPLSRPNSRAVAITKDDIAALPRHNDSAWNEDFDLGGKTSLWGEK